MLLKCTNQILVNLYNWIINMSVFIVFRVEASFVAATGRYNLWIVYLNEKNKIKNYNLQ